MTELDKLLHPISGIMRGLTSRDLVREKLVPIRGDELVAIQRELVRFRSVREHVEALLADLEEEASQASTFVMGSISSQLREMKKIQSMIRGVAHE